MHDTVPCPEMTAPGQTKENNKRKISSQGQVEKNSPGKFRLPTWDKIFQLNISVIYSKGFKQDLQHIPNFVFFLREHVRCIQNIHTFLD